MTLAKLPLLRQRNILKPEQSNEENIDILYDYLINLESSFANAAGEAIDPSLGQGGDGALDIISIPSNITYPPGSGLSIDGVIFGHVDVVFTLPDRAVQAAIAYREQGVSNFKVSFGLSPYRIVNLKVGVIYEIKIAGVAANSKIADNLYSVLTIVTIPTAGSVLKAPADAVYWVGTGNGTLTAEVIPSGEPGVVDVAPLTGVIGVTTSGISTGKLADNSVTTVKRSALTDSTASISLTGTVGVNVLKEQDVTVTHNLNKVVTVTPSLESISGTADTRRFTGVFLTDNQLNSFTVRVVGAFIADTGTITATLHSRYW